MHHFLRIACLVGVIGMGITAEASAEWYQDGVKWYSYNGHPKGSQVGDCYGNCGAGCSSTMNPCGGPAQYWASSILEKHETDSGEYGKSQDSVDRR